MDQRAGRVRRRARSSPATTADPEDIELGLTEEPAQRWPPRSCAGVADAGVGGPALSTAGEDANAIGFEGDDAGFMVNWPFVWPRALTGGRGRHARRSRSRTTTAGRCTRRSSRARRAGRRTAGINIGVGAFSKHADLAYEAAECITSEENQAVLLRQQRQPGRQGRGLRRPGGRRGVPDGPGHPGVARAGRAAAADRVLQRGLQQPPARVPPAELGRTRPRPASRPLTSSRPSWRRRSCCEHHDPAPGEKQRTGLGAPARHQRPLPRRAQAGLDARRPGVRVDAAGHRLPDPAGDLRLAVRLPAHRPGEPVVHRAVQLLGDPHRPDLVDRARRDAVHHRRHGRRRAASSASRWRW